MVEIMAGEGMLDTIADGELANSGNISAAWADPSFDPGRQHSIPYQWGSTSFAVNRDIYTGDISTTDILFNPPAELQGKINVLDSQGEVLAMAALHMGNEQCSTDRDQLKALNDMLQTAKQHWIAAVRCVIQEGPLWADCVEKLEKSALSFFCQFPLRRKSCPYLRGECC
jgi:spermidine/putrescine transport system substrate-binding protein